jgi:hypothetical protein
MTASEFARLDRERDVSSGPSVFEVVVTIVNTG